MCVSMCAYTASVWVPKTAYDTTFSTIKKIKIYRKRMIFHLVELRPKSKSYAKSVVVLVIPRHGQSRGPRLVDYKSF